MAWTQTDIDAVDALIRARVADGSIVVQSTSFPESGAVVFHSLEELWKFRANIASQIAVANGTRTRFARTSKGV